MTDRELLMGLRRSLLGMLACSSDPNMRAAIGQGVAAIEAFLGMGREKNDLSLDIEPALTEIRHIDDVLRRIG